MAESKRFDQQGPGCLEGLFNLLALNQRLHMPKMIAYRKHSDGSNDPLRVKVPKPKSRDESDENIPKEPNNVSPTAKGNMFMWKTLLFKKKSSKKDRKKGSPPANSNPSSSSSRLLRSRSIHHSKCFEYEVPDELASHYHTMFESSSNENVTCHDDPPWLHESPEHPSNQEQCKSCGNVRGKLSVDLESPCEIAPRSLTEQNEVSSQQKNRDAAAHHSQEFIDFLELFNAHRELFLKILHDPSLLATSEQQGQEASSSDAVPLNKLESFPRPGGSSGKRNPIFDRSDSEIGRKPEIERSPSRPNSDIEATKVISARMPTGADGSVLPLAESRSLKKDGTSNRFKAIRRKIKDVVKENRKELARITKDGVFHKLPYGKKATEFTMSHSADKFAQEDKPIRRSYSIAESVDKYSTLYESISRDLKASPERLSITMEGKKLPTSFKRVTSLPEMQLCSPRNEILTEISDSHIGPKAYNMEPGRISSHQTNSFSIFSERNFYHDDVMERSGRFHRERNYGVNSMEANVRSILQSPSLSSLGRSHRRINSLPSFDRSFFQDPVGSFTGYSVADSEPENMQLEDEDWLAKPPHPPGKHAIDLQDAEWLVTPLKRSGVFSAIDHEDEEWLVKTSGANFGEDEEWLVKPGQPLTDEALDSDFHFINEFAEQDVAEPLHIYVGDKNEADFQYVRDILKKSGFSCGEVDWYASNQPLSPVVFEEAESSCQELSMVNDDPHSVVRRMLLFDLINEVLLDIYDTSLIIGPWHSRFDSRTRPIPVGSHVLKEVWAKVSRYLSLQWKAGHTVDDVVAHDVMRKDGWLNLVCDAECTALDVEDLIVEDFLDDVVIQIVLESIDE